MLSESQIKNHHGSWSNWSWLLYCCIHTVIKNIFQNDDHLRKTEDDMKSAFSFFLPRKLCVQKYQSSRIINKQNLRQRKSRKQLIPSSRKPRTQYVPKYYVVFMYMKWKRLLPRLQKVNVIWWMTVSIKMEFYVLLVVFAVIIVAFQFTKNALVVLVQLEMTICFVVMNVWQKM